MHLCCSDLWESANECWKWVLSRVSWRKKEAGSVVYREKWCLAVWERTLLTLAQVLSVRLHISWTENVPVFFFLYTFALTDLTVSNSICLKFDSLEMAVFWNCQKHKRMDWISPTGQRPRETTDIGHWIGQRGPQETTGKWKQRKQRGLTQLHARIGAIRRMKSGRRGSGTVRNYFGVKWKKGWGNNSVAGGGEQRWITQPVKLTLNNGGVLDRLLVWVALRPTFGQCHVM